VTRTAAGRRDRPGPMVQQLARAAHWHADRGMAVFPLRPGTKLPAVKDWEHQATTNHHQIDQTWRHTPVQPVDRTTWRHADVE